MKPAKLLGYDVREYIDCPRIFFCNNLTGDEPYLMVCNLRLDYEMYDEKVAEDYYYNDERVQKLYIDIGDHIAVMYYNNKGQAWSGGELEDIDSEDGYIYLKNGTKIDAESIEGIGLI